MNNEKMPFERFRTYFLYFMAYCIIGWLYEVFLEVVVYRGGFSNRGVMFGPWLPVYGIGALIFVISLRKLKERKIPALAACSSRRTEETVNENGSTQKSTVFIFERFRKY